MKAILAAMGLLMALTGCRHAGIETVDAGHFEALLRAGKLQLVDARTAEEYAAGHISGATNIDVKQEDFLPKAQATLSRKQPVGIYCRSGKRSLAGAEMLSKAKYRVINLRGGILEWQSSGRPVTSDR